MKFKDYYEILGLARSASADEIKQAYRKLARKFHPDVSIVADAEAKFKELGEAYAVLKDPEKRAAYDQMGSQWKSGQDFQPPPNWDAGFEFSGRDSAHVLIAASFSRRSLAGTDEPASADPERQKVRIIMPRY